MCGIFGVINENRYIDSEILIKISSQLRHRGPDDEGFLIFNNEVVRPFKGADSPPPLELKILNPGISGFNNALLHRRLSIIDTSVRGHQPMSYCNERYWITLNGEIYNYLEIKEILVKKAYKFQTSSDTEVVLAAYQEWGEDCVSYFNGMWAFAIYDHQQKQVFCSRDRLGIKPFYYAVLDKRFLFCSEMKGIRTYLDHNIKLNDNKIREYLIRNQIIMGANKETIFNDIFQLLPGHNLLFNIITGFLKTNSYWELKFNKKDYDRFDNYVENFRELFKSSLELRLRSDVDVGSCLSGGLDSSSIVSFASQEFNRTFHTFSAVWPGYTYDEYNFIKFVNDKTKSISHVVTYELLDFLDLHDKIMHHQEVPFAGSSLIAQWIVMQEAKNNGIKVLLDGQGADEILGGYPGYVESYIVELFENFSWGEFFRNRDEWNLDGYKLSNILRIIIYRNKIKLKNKLLNHPKYKSAALPINKAEIFKYFPDNEFKSGIDCNNVTKILKEHITVSNLPQLLHYEDRNSMAHSVEARVPFLDYRLVEFAMTIPSKFRFKGALKKVILRESVKNYLPSEIYHRTDKIGFQTPIEKKIQDDRKLSEIMNDFLLKSELWSSNWLDKTKYSQNHLFALYSLARFIDLYG